MSRTCEVRYSALSPKLARKSISTQSSTAHVEERDQELWGTLEQALGSRMARKCESKHWSPCGADGR